MVTNDISAAREFETLFSAIVMNDVICYVKDPVSAFRASWELLEPGGVLILRVSNKALWLSLGLRLPGLSEKVVAGCCHDHFHVASVSAYLAALKGVGFATAEAGATAMSADLSELSWIGRAIYRVGRATSVLTRGRLRIDPGVLVTASKGT